MGFDWQNFGIGLLAGWGSAYGIYRARKFIGGTITSVSTGAKTAQSSATRSADSRYINDLTERARTTHLGGAFVNLNDVCIEPHFIPAPALAAPPTDDAIHDIYRVVPILPDHPYLYAPYNIDDLTIDDLARGHRHLALLGLPGSGRTTALLSIALYSINEIAFTPPLDKVQQQTDSEEAAMSEKERSVRVRERVMMQQRARERLATERGQAFDGETDDEQKEAIPLFKRLMPVYVHLADVIAPTSEFGSEIDPAEPLVRAVQYDVKRVTASTIPRNLYKRLNRGDTLVLIDGYDDLPESERLTAQHWLRAFMTQYAANFIIVTGPVTGQGDLTKLGLAPVYLRSPHTLDVERTADRWATQWINMAGRGRKKRGAGKPDEASLVRAHIGNQSLSNFELTAKLWANFSDTVEMTGVEGWLRQVIARLLPADLSLGDNAVRLAQIAALQLDEGYITAARLQALSITGLGDAASSAASDDDDATEAVTPAKKGRGKKDEPQDSETTSAQGKLLAALRRSGLLVRHRGDRYQFRHLLLASYLASLIFKTGGESALLTCADRPAWQHALAYTALHTPVDALIEHRMRQPLDMLYSPLFTLARWVSYAPTEATWRGEVLRDLGNVLIAPNQYPAVRERAAAALLETREKTTLLVFRRAVRNANPALRRIACLGMGAMGDPEALKDLAQLPLTDRTPEVQLAAGMALGAIGTTDGYEAMIKVFGSESEQLSQAIAEAFALHPDEGYPLLYEAARHEDMLLRRAAVFGLRRIRTTWALIEVYRRFLDDDQWFVRSAAQQAFEEINYGQHKRYPAAQPPIEEIGWLAGWATERGEKIPAGEAASSVLIRALQEGEAPVRALAALNLGQLGVVGMTKPLYNALRDRQDEVRAAAHLALSTLQLHIGKALPIPT